MSILDFIRNNFSISKKDLYEIPYWDRVRMSQIPVPTDNASWKQLSGFLRIRDVDGSHNLVTRLDIVSEKYVAYEMVLYTIDKYNCNRLLKKVEFHI